MTEKEKNSNGLWLSFSRMTHPYYKNIEVTFTSGKGAYLFDSKGKKYFDGFSTLWTNLVGHGREEVIEAMTAQMRKLSFMHLFTGAQHEPAQQLSERLIQTSPFGHRHVFFGCSGSDATETAIKLARNYWYSKKQPQKNIIVGRLSTYHGTSYGALSLMGHDSYQEPYGPLVDRIHRVPPTDIDALEEYFKQVDAKRNIAAVLIEPIITSDSLIIAPQEYWDRLAKLCKANDVLLISDEVSTGMGRTGELYGASLYGLKPDIAYLAKSLTSGYAPLSAVMTTEEIFRSINADGSFFMHGSTFAGHPVACVAALKTWDIMSREGLVNKSKETGQVLKDVWKNELTGLPEVTSINGEGTLYHIGLSVAPAKEVEFGMRLYRELLDRGQYIRVLGRFICIAPPPISTVEEVREMGRVIRAAIEKLRREREVWE